MCILCHKSSLKISCYLTWEHTLPVTQAAREAASERVVVMDIVVVGSNTGIQSAHSLPPCARADDADNRPRIGVVPCCVS